MREFVSGSDWEFRFWASGCVLGAEWLFTAVVLLEDVVYWGGWKFLQVTVDLSVVLGRETCTAWVLILVWILIFDVLLGLRSCQSCSRDKIALFLADLDVLLKLTSCQGNLVDLWLICKLFKKSLFKRLISNFVMFYCPLISIICISIRLLCRICCSRTQRHITWQKLIWILLLIIIKLRLDLLILAQRS